MKYTALQGDLPPETERMRKGFKISLIFLQNTAFTYHANGSLQLYLHFFSATSPAKESNQNSQGLVGELIGMCFQTASADSIHQNQTELFKDALSMTLLC